MITCCPGVISVLSGGYSCDYILSGGDFSVVRRGAVVITYCPGVISAHVHVNIHSSIGGVQLLYID